MRRLFSPYFRTRRQARGFALLLMLVLVTLGLLFTVVTQVSAVGMKWNQAQGGNVALLQAKEALLGYAATYRDTHIGSGEVFGYLPCPDADGDGDADTANTSGACGSSSQIVVGLLPYRTLGLDDVRDADGNCLWYAVSPSYKASLSKSTPMNWDTRGQIRILDKADITALANPVGGIEGGAVAVIFTAGPALAGNVPGRSSNVAKLCGNNGKINWAAYLESVPSDPAGSTGMDLTGNSTANPLTITQGTPNSSTNNDLIAWITPKEIFDKVKKRSDQGGMNVLSSQIASALQSKINTDLTTAAAPSANTLPNNSAPITGPTPYSGQVGELPTSVTVSTTPVDYSGFLSNWKNQYRYAVCNNLCGYCLTVGGTSCNAALVFGAEHTTGGPRPTQPALFAELFENDGNVVGDGKGALSLLNGSSNSFTGASTYTSGSADVGICVAPISQKPATFSCDLAGINKAAPTLADGSSLINIDTNTGTLTLGQHRPLGNPAGHLFGCAWFPQAMTFGTGIRVYFNFKIVESGRGFVFAIMDDSQYSASAPPCGKSNQFLGYAGDNLDPDFPPIKPPKIGLEIHTTNAFAQGSPGYQHAALVYWGDNNNTATNDDNQHGAINSLAGFPSNSSTQPGLSANLGPSGANILATNNTVHVRMDIERIYASTANPPGTYKIKTWLVKGVPTTTQLADLRNMAVDFGTTIFGAATPITVSDTFTTKNLPTGASIDPEAMQKIRFGFTLGQGAGTASDEIISISNFIAVPR